MNAERLRIELALVAGSTAGWRGASWTPRLRSVPASSLFACIVSLIQTIKFPVPSRREFTAQTIDIACDLGRRFQAKHGVF